MSLKEKPFALLTFFAVKKVRRPLLAWYRKNRRDLPWRRTADPYAIWVSEVMLQQTQVAAVLPYYERFLARFPTLESLARAPGQTVLKCWEGLGYYRRAMNLHAAARVVMRDHGGCVPDDPAAFAALPGVGRYTCGAVQSIAFGRRLAAVDGNATRVIARWLGVTACVDDAKTRALIERAAEEFVPTTNPLPLRERVAQPGEGSKAGDPANTLRGGSPHPPRQTEATVRGRSETHHAGRCAAGTESMAVAPLTPTLSLKGRGRMENGNRPPNNPGDWNQALMELGATVCLPRSPRCDVCPVRRQCVARAKDLVGRIPAKKKRKPVPHIEVGAGIIWRRGRVLLCRRPADAMLGGLWEFPGGKLHRGESAPACIRRELREECDLPVTVGPHLVDVTHTYSHLRVTLRCYHCQAGPGRVKLIGCDEARWVRPEEIRGYPLPAADVRIVAKIMEERPPRGKRAANVE
jgi:mutator protein MutT